MSVKVANNLFIVSSVTGFYQQFLKGALNFQELGDRLVKKAEAAFYLRQVDSLKEYGLLLSNLPIKEYQLIGQYYLGLCEYYNGSNETGIFENVLENSTSYRPKALMGLAAIEARKGNYALEGHYFAESMKYADSITTIIKASKSIAIVKSKERFHKSAIKDLESLIPIIKYAEPFVYFNFLNSYAVELGETGRIEEAQNVCRITLASPFINAYPEWRETWQELALRGYKSRSSVPVIQSFFKPAKAQNEKIQNILSFPERNTAPVRLRSKPAKVLDLQAWREKMAEEEKDEIPPDADEGDLYLRLMELIALKDLNAWELRQVIDFVEKLRPKENKN